MDTIDFPFRCIKCDSDLQGVAVVGACPACGHSVADMLRDLSVDPASGTVSDDVPCAACGYNLRTLAAKARCPECGMDVAASLRSDELRLADGAWLRRVRCGVRILGFSASATGLTCLTESAWVWGLIDGSNALRAFVYVVRFLLMPVWLGGIWLATESEPLPRVARRSETVRQVARWCSILSVFLATASNWRFLEAVWMHGLGGAMDAIAANVGNMLRIAVAAATGACLAAIGFGACVVWLRRLALRARRRGLSGWMIVLLLAVLLSGALHISGWFFVAFQLAPPAIVVVCWGIYPPSFYVAEAVILLICSSMLTDTIRWQDQNTLANTP